MRTITLEDYQEFAQRHGGEPLEIAGRLWFPDGASVSGDNADVRWEPSADPTVRLQAGQRYHRRRLDLLEQRFYATRESFSEQGALAARYANLPGPPEEAPQILEDMKQAVVEARQTLARIDGDLAKTDQARRARENAELDDQRRSELNQLHQQINSVVLDD